MLAREQPARDRVVGNHAQPLFRAQREQLALDLAEEQVVAGLHGVEPRQPQELAAPQRARHLVGVVVRAADVTRLARPDHVVERAQGLVHGRRGVGVMELVEIDVIGAQPAQRGVDRVEDVLARQPLIPGPRAHRTEALGGEDEVVSPPREPAAEDLLGAADRAAAVGAAAALGIGIRGVEERDAARGGPLEDRAPGRLVALQAERHRAQAQAGDTQPGAPELNVLHQHAPERRLTSRVASWRPRRSGSRAVDTAGTCR